MNDTSYNFNGLAAGSFAMLSVLMIDGDFVLDNEDTEPDWYEMLSWMEVMMTDMGIDNITGLIETCELDGMENNDG